MSARGRVKNNASAVGCLRTPLEPFGGRGPGFRHEPEDLKIWFGILAPVVFELGLITPTVGMNVFVISALAKDLPMSQTFLGVMPFFVAELFRMVLLVMLPVPSPWLPSILAG